MIRKQIHGPTSKRKVSYGDGRESIRKAAKKLFYVNGLSTGLDAILKEADVTKPTFYHHFSGRSVLEADYFHSMADELWSSLERIAKASHSSKQFITRWMQLIRRRAVTDGYGGCPLGNFAIQSDIHHGDLVKRVFELSVDHLREGLILSGMERKKASELSPDLFAIYQGSLLIVRATRDAGAFTRATRLMVKLTN